MAGSLRGERRTNARTDRSSSQAIAESTSRLTTSAPTKKAPVRTASRERANLQPAGDGADAAKNRPARHQRRARIAQPLSPARPDLRHLTAEDYAGPDAPDAKQRRQREQQRRQNTDRQSLDGGSEVPVLLRTQMEITRDERRKGRFDRGSERHPHQASRQSQAERLQQIDLHDFPRARANAFHDGDGIHLLLQVRVHGRGHAERAHNQRDEAHQAQECGRAVQTLGDDRMRLAEIGDQRIGKIFLQGLAHFFDAGDRRASSRNR